MKFTPRPVQMRMPSNRGMILFIVVFGLIVFFWRIVGLVTDWFWFQEVGYESVFSVTLWAQIKTALVFGLAFFAVFYANLFAAARLSSKIHVVVVEGSIHVPPWGIANQQLNLLILIVSLLFSFFAASSGANQWENYLKFFNASSFGVSDPLFQRDIGFYVFQLPFLKHIYGWVLMVLIVTSAAVGLLYFMRRAFVFAPPHTWQVDAGGPQASEHSRVAPFSCGDVRGLDLAVT